jgi:hypothetical protein
MDSTFLVPPDFQQGMHRLMPYMSHELRNDPQRLETIMLFYKLGGDKLAKIVIDAFNQTQRLLKVHEQRLRLRISLMDTLEDMEKEDDDDDDGDDEEDRNASDDNEDDLTDY